MEIKTEPRKDGGVNIRNITYLMGKRYEWVTIVSPLEMRGKPFATKS